MRTNTPKVGDDLEVDGETFPQQMNLNQLLTNMTRLLSHD